MGLVGRSLRGIIGWVAWWFWSVGFLLRVVFALLFCVGWFLLCWFALVGSGWFGVGWSAGGSEAAGAGHKPACRGGDAFEVALVLHDGVAAQQRGGGAR